MVGPVEMALKGISSGGCRSRSQASGGSSVSGLVGGPTASSASLETVLSLSKLFDFDPQQLAKKRLMV